MNLQKPSIHIGSVKIPLMDYAVSCTAILGIRDSGKTVTAKGIAEQLLEHNVPIVVFDAVGKWRWLKVPGTGPRAKGFKVVVAGGRHPDLPLSTHSVVEIVRASVREKIPLVIDLYDPKLSKADWRRIVQQSIHIIHYEANGVCHVFLEEAAEYIPQKVMDGETYAEVEKLARMGGNASVGITLINQRSQEVNKAVLDLSHNLVLGCQIGNKAIEAVEKWVDRLSPDIAEKVTTSLPRLQSGEVWVWTRSNPDDPVQEQLPMCRSLHPDRRTPEAALDARKSVNTEEFVATLSGMLPKIVEEQKANDPKELRRQLADAKRELEKARNANITTAAQAETITVDKPVLKDGQLARLEKLADRIEKWEARSAESATALRDAFGELRRTIEPVIVGAVHRTATTPKPSAFGKRLLQSAPKPRTGWNASADPNGSPPSSAGDDQTERLLGKGERAILTCIAQHNPRATREQITVLTGYKRSSRDTYIQRLQQAGYVQSFSDHLEITQDGINALGNDFEPLPTGDALREYWLRRLSGGEQVIFQKVIDAYPNPIARETISDTTHYQRSSRDTYLQRLQSRQLVESIGRGEVIASKELFE